MSTPPVGSALSTTRRSRNSSARRERVCRQCFRLPRWPEVCFIISPQHKLVMRSPSTKPQRILPQSNLTSRHQTLQRVYASFDALSHESRRLLACQLPPSPTQDQLRLHKRHFGSYAGSTMNPARSYPAAATIWTGTILPASGVSGFVSGAVMYTTQSMSGASACDLPIQTSSRCPE